MKRRETLRQERQKVGHEIESRSSERQKVGRQRDRKKVIGEMDVATGLKSDLECFCQEPVEIRCPLRDNTSKLKPWTREREKLLDSQPVRTNLFLCV